jgi:pyruvate dehydrogenase kinase 2/3/4
LRSGRNPIRNAADLFSFSHVRNAARLDVSRLGALRTASASESGVRGTIDEQLGRWQQAREHYSTASVIDDAAVQQILHPRIGIGLPMSYIYARYGIPSLILYFKNPKFHRYFGGSLELVSLDDWGQSFVKPFRVLP